MKRPKLLLTFLCLAHSPFALAGNDFLTQQQIRIAGPNADQAVAHAVADPMDIFDNFQPLLDSGSTVVSPFKVRGSKNHPVIQLSVQKCMMAIACGSVSLVGEVSLAPAAGKCTKNYKLHVDLSRSSEALSGTYDSLDADLCYQRNNDGSGTLTLSQSAHRASRFEAGTMQQQVLGFMKQQAPQLTQAFREKIRSSTLEIARAN